MTDPNAVAPENTAVRVALWRALHLEVDAAPHVLVDDVGAKIAAPEPGWQSRGDMSAFTRPFRASIVARARPLVMSFMLPIEMAPADIRPGIEAAMKGARASGTPFISFFTPAAMLALAREAGFRDVQHVSADVLAERYFAGRSDGLRPPSNSEELIVAT